MISRSIARARACALVLPPSLLLCLSICLFPSIFFLKDLLSSSGLITESLSSSFSHLLVHMPNTWTQETERNDFKCLVVPGAPFWYSLNTLTSLSIPPPHTLTFPCMTQDIYRNFSNMCVNALLMYEVFKKMFSNTSSCKVF